MYLHPRQGEGASDIYQTHMPLSTVVVPKKNFDLPLSTNGTKCYVFFKDLGGPTKNPKLPDHPSNHKTYLSWY